MSRESWWLDYVEGELDPATRAEMKALLRHSKADREVVEALSSTKELLKEHEPPATEPADDLFFDALHDKIMAAVEETVVKPAPRAATQRLKKNKRLLISSGGVAAFAMLLLSVCFLSTSSQQTGLSSTNQILQAALQSPDESLRVLGVQSQNDFFVDVAGTSFDDLNIMQLQGLLKTKTRVR